MLRVDPSWQVPCQCGPVLGWIRSQYDWCLHLEWKHRLVESIHGCIVRSNYHHDFQHNPHRVQVTSRQICSYNDNFKDYLPPYNIYFYSDEGELLPHRFSWPSENRWLVRWYVLSYLV